MEMQCLWFVSDRFCVCFLCQCWQVDTILFLFGGPVEPPPLPIYHHASKGRRPEYYTLYPQRWVYFHPELLPSSKAERPETMQRCTQQSMPPMFAHAHHPSQPNHLLKDLLPTGRPLGCRLLHLGRRRANLVIVVVVVLLVHVIA